MGLAYLGFRHYLWPRLDDWRPVVLAQLSAAAGRPVTIGRIEGGFEGLQPRLTVEDLRIDDDDGTPALLVPRATAVLSLTSILAGELRLSVLQFDSPLLRVERLDEQRLRVAGVELALDGADEGRSVHRLVGQRRILLHDATLDWIDRHRGVRNRFEKVELAVGSVGRRHRGDLTIGASGPGWHRLQAVIEIYREAGSNPTQWRRWSGDAYLGVEGFDAAQAAEFVELPVPLASAAGELKAWMSFGAGRARDLRVKLAARGLEWRTPNGPVHLAELRTDLSARPSGDGYRLSAAQFELEDATGFRLNALGELGLVVDARGVPRSGNASFAPFDTAPALAFARTLPLAPEVRERLEALKVAGAVTALSARWTNDTRIDFDAAVEFDGLSLSYRDARAEPPSPPRRGARPAKRLSGRGCPGSRTSAARHGSPATRAN